MDTPPAGARRAIIFDLDGTLVDSLPDIAAAANAVLAEQGLAPLAEAEVRAMVGDGALALMRAAAAARGVAALPDAWYRRFLAVYGAAPAARTKAYPEVPETLAALRQRGFVLGICTNKPQAPAEALLAALGLADLFAAVVGGDVLAVRKPDPAHLLAVVERLGCRPGEAIYVGDNEHDAAAAAAAGLPFALVGHGYARVAPDSLPARWRLARFGELLAVV
ncbi:MAG: phosphoglycolate phosphatase [Thalassobaculales bacterium]